MLKRDAAWLGANALFAAFFLWSSSRLWIEPEVRDIPGASVGNPIIFTLLALVLLGPLLLFDLVGLVLAVRRGLRDRTWIPLGVVCLTLGAWVDLVRFSASLVGD
jgi:hypothetical protein